MGYKECIQTIGGKTILIIVHLKDQEVDRRIILRWIFRRQVLRNMIGA